jgi:hypothetical protein
MIIFFNSIFGAQLGTASARAEKRLSPARVDFYQFLHRKFSVLVEMDFKLSHIKLNVMTVRSSAQKIIYGVTRSLSLQLFNITVSSDMHI